MFLHRVGVERGGVLHRVVGGDQLVRVGEEGLLPALTDHLRQVRVALAQRGPGALDQELGGVLGAEFGREVEQVLQRGVHHGAPGLRGRGCLREPVDRAVPIEQGAPFEVRGAGRGQRQRPSDDAAPAGALGNPGRAPRLGSCWSRCPRQFVIVLYPAG